MSFPQTSMFDDWQTWAEAITKELEDIIRKLPKGDATGKLGEFYKTVGPGYLECDGAGFSEDSYPALAQMLGSNVLPNLTSVHGVDYVVGIKT